MERLAKWIAHSGYCSRRKAEALILEGSVIVNDTIVKHPLHFVDGSETIQVKNQILKAPEQMNLWCYHKPKGLLTTHHDPENRPTVFDALRQTFPHILSIGRLDMNSEGLLLLTNYGPLAHLLESPQKGLIRKYRVRTYGTINDDVLAKIKKGITYGGINYHVHDIHLDQKRGLISWLTLSLKEGKNREIRNIFEALDIEVTRLIRISYGPFLLGNLKRGEIKQVPAKMLKEQLGRDYERLQKHSQ